MAPALAPAQEPEPRADPVDQLRQALRVPMRDAAVRDAQVRTAVGRLRSLDQFQRALLLGAWRDRDHDEKVAANDAPLRAAVVERFERGLRAALRPDDPDGQLEALRTVAALDPSLRGTGALPLMRDFTADLAGLLASGPAAVRERAARTLGRIDPEPGTAARALAALLKDPESRLRAAAGEALSDLVATAARLAASGAGSAGDPEDVLRAACAVVPAAGGGLANADAAARRLCAEALCRCAEVLGALTAAPVAADEVEDWAEYQREVDDERAALQPLSAALRAQGAALACAAADADPRVRLATRQALENLAEARVRLLRRASSSVAAPQTGGDPEGGARSARYLLEDPLLAGLRQALPALTAGVSDADAEARLAAIDVLEALGRQAAPAAPALVVALSDHDRFVRWAAARALGKIRPPDVGTVVPALARLLGDGDRDVALSALAALAAFGPGARAALPALLEAAQAREPELRMAALRALESIGSEDAASLAALSAALTDTDSRVREVATEVLESAVPSRREAVKALLRPSAREGEGPAKAVGSVQPTSPER